MSQINPFTGSILQAPHVQRAQANDRDRQLRRASELSKNAALQGDELHHEVESSEAISPVQDEQQKKPPQKRKRRKLSPAQGAETDSTQHPHIDLTA